MKKKILLASLVILSVFLLCACKFYVKLGNKNNNGSKDTKKSESDTTTLTTKINTDVEEKSLDGLNFDQYNVLSYTIESRDDDSYDEIIARVKIKNNGKKTIDNILLEMSFVDASGKEVCKGTGACEYAIGANKEILVTVYSDLEDADKSTVKNIVLSEYYYCEDINTYHVLVNDKKIEGYTSNENLGNVDFDKANILKIVPGKGGIEYDTYKVPLSVTNNSKVNLERVGIDVALFDKNGVVIDEGIGSSDGKVDAAKTVTIDCLGDFDNVAKDITNLELYSYYYELEEKDSNGYNYYVINLQRKTAKGMDMD